MAIETKRAQELLDELGMRTWYPGNDGFGGEWIYDTQAIEAVKRFASSIQEETGRQIESRCPHCHLKPEDEAAKYPERIETDGVCEGTFIRGDFCKTPAKCLAAGVCQASLEQQLAEARSQGEWIKCSERLPEYDKDVLLWGDGWQQVYVGYWRHSEEWFGRRNPDLNGALPATDPTHWREFPAPPKTQRCEHGFQYPGCKICADNVKLGVTPRMYDPAIDEG